jgi:sugar lactone lactonase YvrE
MRISGICAVILLVASLTLTACVEVQTGAPGAGKPGETGLALVAESPMQWTGVAVSKNNRLFVNFPRWSDKVPVSVAEIGADGKTVPFPDAEWNSWAEGKDAATHFVCVQSVYFDSDGFLWVLDPANPKFGGVVAHGPKLVKFDIAARKPVQTIVFDERAALPNSYLNDVRVDTKRGFAYITDSGVGALLVVDLKTGKPKRVLEDHFSTASEDIRVIIGGKEWLRNGVRPQVQADGIALDPTGLKLYFKALTARSLYRIDTDWLRGDKLVNGTLGRRVEKVATAFPTDGLEFGADGQLYLTSIEDNSVKRLDDKGNFETVAQDARLVWPDSLAVRPDGVMYVTSSRINLTPNPKEPYRLFKFMP